MRETVDTGPLCECPVCKAEVPSDNLGVAYRPEGGWPRMLAECPECESCVHPK